MINSPSIVIEDVLTEMFSYLPEQANASGKLFKPTFMYGDDIQLLDFLRQNSGKSNYPLIWMIYPFVEIQRRSGVEFNNLTFVLAVETNSKMLNQQRLKETYAKVLMPLFDNIRECFHQANVANVIEEYTVTKHPNYSSERFDQANATTYIWDAMKISLSGKFNNNCLKPIYFNN